MISVIVPTYNRAKVLPKSIESILCQTYKDFELIIVDDGSTDNTREVINSYQDARIRYIKNTAKYHGPSFARNIGIRESKGEFIAFNDSDDEWHEDKLEKQTSYLQQKKADITFCMMHRGRVGSGQWIPIDSFSQQDCTLERILRGSFTGTPALFGKAECFKNSLFDTHLTSNEDWEIVIRLLKEYKVVYQKENLVEVTVTEASVSSDYDNAIIAMNYILKKHRVLYHKYQKSLKRMKISIKYQKALSKDTKLRELLKEHVSVWSGVCWLKYRIIRYMYALCFFIDKG